VSDPGPPAEESAEELFEEAPCGYLTTDLDGTIVRVNRTFEAWTGLGREELVGRRRFQDLLSPGGRIYHETHFAPLLRMQGAVREIAVEVVCADGARLPALVNAVLCRDEAGRPHAIRTTVFDATERRRYERELLRARDTEREIALELQRSLLSGELPAGPGLAVEVAYRPAVRGTEVGGDWYDAFWLEQPGTAALVVGDVVGRGIAAAATMGQLRSAVRALAAAGGPPGKLLETLDRHVRRHDVGRMTTVAYAQVDLGTRELRYAAAGHPPPVLLEPGRSPRLLWGGRSVPLDAGLEAGPRPDDLVVVAPGSSLLLYTDGLIERRGSSLSAGFDGLLAALGRLAAGSGGLAESVLQELSETGAEADDVCVLAAHLR
jgi:phosphoserine phosphatase RsbU/P